MTKAGGLFIFVSMILLIFSKYTAKKELKEMKNSESFFEKEIRHRNAFVGDMHIYQMIIITGVFFSINFLM